MTSTAPLALAAVVLTWSSLLAAAEDTEDTALAEALFREGRRLMKAENYEEACPKFDESYRIVPKLGTLLNLATCHDEEGKTGSAWGEYTKAVTMAKEAGEPARVEYAREMLADLEPRLSRLVIEVPEPVTGIEVLVDDKAIGEAAWRTPLPLDPGEHAIAARAPGHATWSETVEIEPGPASQTLSVPPLEPIDDGPTEPAPPDAADEEDPGMSPYTTAGLVVGGLGLAAVGVGTYFGVDTFMKKDDSAPHCDGTLCDQQGVDLRDQARTSADISTATIAVGGAALGTGIILLIVGAYDEPGEEKAEEAAFSLAPILGARHYGATMEVTW